MLAAIGYPPGDESLMPMRNRGLRSISLIVPQARALNGLQPLANWELGVCWFGGG